jgi:hypothetical protein
MTIGYIDGIRFRQVYGWAHSPDRSSETPYLRISVNGKYTGLVAADRPRPDLQAVGIDLPRGFEWTLPDACETVEAVTVTAVADNTSLPRDREFSVCETTNRNLPAQWVSGPAHRFPSFFILGAAKCGTTSVHGYLSQHPEVCMSNPKEPFFFEAEFENGSAYYFNRYFSHWKDETTVGEARHRNLYMPYTAERIHAFNPQARLIVCLRNPAQRAVSHWWHWYSRGMDPLSFAQAIEEDRERIESRISYDNLPIRNLYQRMLTSDGKGILRTYLDSGYYYEQIERFLRLYPRSHLHVVLLEDLVRDPERVMAAILDFIGVDAGFASQMDYTPLNRSEGNMMAQVDSSTLDWLAEHYRLHNSGLLQLLGRKNPEWNEQPSGI